MRTVTLIVLAVLGLASAACIVHLPDGEYDCLAVPVAGQSIPTMAVHCEKISVLVQP